MLVFLSDVHLTDGTTGETIHPGAFRKFVRAIEDMADAAGAVDIEVAFLGDIFDVIRSDYWLRSEIRPWSNGKERDGRGRSLKDYTMEIVRRITENPQNVESINHLKDFRRTMESKEVPVRFSYFIGNHDWLINRYDETREMISRFMELDEPNRYLHRPFETERFWDGYRVFARHGDVYDPFNFDGDRDSSSIGDAIVIDLVNRLPVAVENRIGKDTDPELIAMLREIDNVRPLVDIPHWLQGVCQRAVSVKVAEEVKETWNDLVDDFLEIDFVRAHDKPWQLDVVDALEMGLKITKYMSFRDLANIPMRKFQKEDEYYRERAYNEEHLRRNEAEFVLYGHTHSYRIDPLDLVPLESGLLQKTYFNTGTWRKVHVKAAFDRESYEFTSWHVLTFIAFYLDEERGSRRFEVWNGALG